MPERLRADLVALLLSLARSAWLPPRRRKLPCRSGVPVGLVNTRSSSPGPVLLSRWATTSGPYIVAGFLGAAMMIAMGLVQSQSNAIRDDSEMVNAIEEISFGEVWSGLARMRRHQGGAFGAAVRSRVGLCLARERRVKAAFGVARDQQLPSPDPQPAPKDPAPPRNPGKPLASA